MLLFRLAVEVLMSNDFQWAVSACTIFHMRESCHLQVTLLASPFWVSLKGTIGFIYPHVHPNLGPTTNNSKP